jgi:uncharacterized protein
MPLPRLILLLLIGFIAWKAYRLFLSRRTRQPPTPPLQDMVRCAVCDIHVPAASAVRCEGKSFCGDTHRQEFLARSGSE